MKETDLYLPLKSYLEAQGYEVKGEVQRCDVVARRGSEDPLIVELKLSLNMGVLLQAVDRLSLSKTVYIGVPHNCASLKTQRKRIRKLFRLVGIGLIAIDPTNKTAPVAIILDPTDYQPRVNNKKRKRLLGEFEKRVGDPNAGGSTTKRGLMTAYRQRALKLAGHLEIHGAAKASDLAKVLNDPQARDLMYRDVYGWFDREGKGVYALSPKGNRELKDWSPSPPKG